MTKPEFLTSCLERFIDPALALENENVCEALKNKDDAKVIYLLDNEF